MQHEEKLCSIKSSKRKKEVLLLMYDVNLPISAHDLNIKYNIDVSMFSKILNELSNDNLIQLISKRKRNKNYLLTDEGKKICEDLRTLYEFLEND